MGDILFLAHRAPYPPDRGDKIRAFHVLKHLATRRRVHLIGFIDDPTDLRAKSGLHPFTASRQFVWRRKSNAAAMLESLATHRPASVAAFGSPALRTLVDHALAAHVIDTIYVYSSQMAQYLPARSRQRVIMDFVDVDSAKFADYAKNARGPMRWAYAREAGLLLRHDRAVARRADASLFVSEAEAELFRERSGVARVHAIENGIDTTRFDPCARFGRLDADGRLIVFTGQMDYPPNVQAVRWFVQSILPHIRLRHPDARFMIVGRAPTAEVRGLANSPGVTVTGEVADVRGWLAAASVVVAPLKLARGVQNKVLEAMAMARPVVASAAAADGIDHDGTIRVAADVSAMVEAVNALLGDPWTAETLGTAARARVIARYGWAAALAPLDRLLTIRPEAARRAAA